MIEIKVYRNNKKLKEGKDYKIVSQSLGVIELKATPRKKTKIRVYRKIV